MESPADVAYTSKWRGTGPSTDCPSASRIANWMKSEVETTAFEVVGRTLHEVVKP